MPWLPVYSQSQPSQPLNNRSHRFHERSLTFFAAPRMDRIVAFFVVVVGFFALPAKTFLGAAAVFLAATFAAGAAAFLVLAGLVLEGGLEFCMIIEICMGHVNDIHLHTSFEPDVNGFVLGASLTLPDGPLGSTKIPASAPLVMARFNWDRLSPDMSIL